MNRHKKITIERWTDSWKNSADDHYLNTSFPFGLPWVSKDVIFFGLQGMSVRQLHRTNKIFPENLHSKIQRTKRDQQQGQQESTKYLSRFTSVFSITRIRHDVTLPAIEIKDKEVSKPERADCCRLVYSHDRELFANLAHADNICTNCNLLRGNNPRLFSERLEASSEEKQHCFPNTTYTEVKCNRWWTYSFQIGSLPTLRFNKETAYPMGDSPGFL